MKEIATPFFEHNGESGQKLNSYLFLFLTSTMEQQHQDTGLRPDETQSKVLGTGPSRTKVTAGDYRTALADFLSKHIEPAGRLAAKVAALVNDPQCDVSVEDLRQKVFVPWQMVRALRLLGEERISELVDLIVEEKRYRQRVRAVIGTGGYQDLPLNQRFLFEIVTQPDPEGGAKKKALRVRRPRNFDAACRLADAGKWEELSKFLSQEVLNFRAGGYKKVMEALFPKIPLRRPASKPSDRDNGLSLHDNLKVAREQVLMDLLYVAGESIEGSWANRERRLEKIYGVGDDWLDDVRAMNDATGFDSLRKILTRIDGDSILSARAAERHLEQTIFLLARPGGLHCNRALYDFRKTREDALELACIALNRPVVRATERDIILAEELSMYVPSSHNTFRAIREGSSDIDDIRVFFLQLCIENAQGASGTAARPNLSVLLHPGHKFFEDPASARRACSREYLMRAIAVAYLAQNGAYEGVGLEICQVDATIMNAVQTLAKGIAPKCGLNTIRNLRSDSYQLDPDALDNEIYEALRTVRSLTVGATEHSAVVEALAFYPDIPGAEVFLPPEGMRPGTVSARRR